MPDTAAPDYLDPRTLAAIGSLEIRARLIVEGLLTGMHRSPYQGFAVEFAQHRAYAPGDDIRRLDWKVFGKTDKLYLKQYEKETNLDLIVMVDASGSMAYGGGRAQGAGPRAKQTKAEPRSESDSAGPSSLGPGPYSWSKFDHAATVAAAMTYLALKQQDRVGATLFSDHILDVTRMSNTHDHWRSIVETLAGGAPDAGALLTASAKAGAGRGGDAEKASESSAGNSTMATSGPGRTTDLVRVFDQVLARLSQRSLLVLISDLFDSAESLENALARVHHRRHDLIVLQVLDPAERTFPFRDPSDFLGLETEGRLKLDPLALREAYLEALNAHLRVVEAATRRFHFDHLILDTGESVAAPLSHFLARRAARAGRRG